MRPNIWKLKVMLPRDADCIDLGIGRDNPTVLEFPFYPTESSNRRTR
jgi:hypothetical protein